MKMRDDTTVQCSALLCFYAVCRRCEQVLELIMTRLALEDKMDLLMRVPPVSLRRSAAELGPSVCLIFT